MVAAVLAEGTLKHDLIRKRPACEAMPGLRRILYLSTDETRLDVRVWGDDMAEGLEGTATPPEIGVNLPEAEVYGDTEVASASPPSSSRSSDNAWA